MVSLARWDGVLYCRLERQTHRLQRTCSISLAASAERVDFHSRDDKDQFRHTHFRHSNGNHNGYLQFAAKFVIFRILKFPNVRCVLRAIKRWGGISNHLSMAYLLSSICTKNYLNRTTIVEIIIGGWVVSFFETPCIYTVSQKVPAF